MARETKKQKADRALKAGPADDMAHDGSKPFLVTGRFVGVPGEYPSILSAGLSAATDKTRRVVFFSKIGVVDVTEVALWEAARFRRMNPRVTERRVQDIMDAASLFPDQDETKRGAS